MNVHPGGQIWIPCEVKPGPFANERLVRVCSDFAEWVGFVPIEILRDSLLEGETFIRGTITDVQNDRFEVYFAAHAVTSNVFAGSVAKVEALGSVEAGHPSLPR
ncbi:MAG TPA: hypothetical protein VMU84_00840 [Thermoanaerobaculia bacterium]|nr:hypothetical protein [Thermoanaerobaculia bacterium]